MPTTPPDQPRHSVKAALGLLLVVLSFGLHSPAIGYELTIDDPLVTTLNPEIAALDGGWTRYFRQGLFAGTSMERDNDNLYRPLLTSSLALDYRVAGNRFSPAQLHVTNLLLFAACVLAVFLVSCRLLAESTPDHRGDSVVVAFAVALLFAVFPSHLESICNIKHREEILALLFGLSSWLAVLKARPGNLALTTPLAASAFLLALLSKESAILFLPCFALWGWARGERGRTLWTWTSAFALSILVYMLLRHSALGSFLSPAGTRTFFDASVGTVDRVLMASTTFIRFYLWDQLIAMKLSPAFSSPFVIPHAGSASLLDLLSFLGLLASACVSLWRFLCRGSLLAFGWIFFLLTSLLTFQVVPIGTGGAFRLVFSGSFGLCLFLALALTRVLGTACDEALPAGFPSCLDATRRQFRRLVPVFILALYFGIQTALHLGHWRNDHAVFVHATRACPTDPLAPYAVAAKEPDQASSLRAHYLALSLERFRDWDKDGPHFNERSLDAYSVVATEVAFSRIGSDPRSALELAELGIGVFETLEIVRHGRSDTNIVGPYYVKALALNELGRRQESIATCREALSVTPHRGLQELLTKLTHELP